MSCRECGLYRNCISAKMKPESLFAENSKGTVLVIGSYPSVEEDQESKFFVGASELLRDMLSGLEEEGISWVYTTALRCHPGKDFEGNYVKATDEHIAHCQDEYLLDVLTARKYDCIIYLGTQAMKTIFGEECPKSLAAAKSLGTVYLEETPVLGSYSPSAYNMQQYDLVTEYVNLFTKAIKIVKGELQDVPFNYEVVESADTGRLPVSLDGPIFLDVEVEEVESDPNRCTYRHPGARLLCTGVSWRETTGEYVNIVLVPRASTAEYLARLCSGNSVYAHNTKYDLGVLKHHCSFDAYSVAGDTGDTYLDFYSLNIGGRGLGLGALASKHLDAPDWKSEVWKHMDAAKKTRSPGWSSFGDIPKDLLYRYNARDGFWTCRLYHEVLKHHPLFNAYKWNKELLRDLTEVLLACENRGFLIDEAERLRIVRQCHERELETFRLIEEHPAVKVVTQGFSVDEKDTWGIKLGEALPDGRRRFKPTKVNTKSVHFLNHLSVYLGYHTGEKGEAGNLSFEKDILKVLAGLLPEVPDPNDNQKLFRLIRENRTLRDLNSKYLASLPDYIIDGRIHYNFKMASTVTGRLSCANFNIQQIKKKSGLRRMFIASPGFKLVSMDYDRIELVVLAFLSQEPRMLEAVRNKEDLHQVTASLIKGATREMGKTANFGMVYGQGVKSFAAKTGLSLAEAMKFMDEFRKQFSAIETYYNSLDRLVEEEGVIVTPSQRRREFTHRDSRNQWRNFPIQSLASDINSSAAVRVYQAFKGTKWSEHVHMLALIHDDIVFEVREEHLVKICTAIKAIMEDTSKLPFKFDKLLSVGISIGDNWEDMEDYVLRDGQLVLKEKE